MRIVSLWSGPRNVSTALMYAFAQRPDTQVIDEPLYAHYLSNSDARHPGENEVLETMENNGTVVLKHLSEYKATKKILFLKNMAHHWVNLNEQWLRPMDHIFLIRDPRQMLPSLIHQIPHPVIRDTGLKTQVALYKILIQQEHEPLIIDSRTLLINPRSTLQKICQKLKIPYYEEMLSWERGGRKEDGIWAKHWYHNVHQSTGFEKYKSKEAPFPDRLRPLLEECDPHYQFLYANSLK